MKILGLIGRSDVEECHDAAATLIDDGRIVWALEQERLSRRRHAHGEGPADAAEKCLQQMGLTIDEIDFIAYGWIDEGVSQQFGRAQHIRVSQDLAPAILPAHLLENRKSIPVHLVKHHYAHAASCFYTSGFDSAAIMVIDGQGENESVSLYHAEQADLALLESYDICYSLGLFYEAAAHYCGLGWDAGGKLMGLAAFGRPTLCFEYDFDSEIGRFTLPKLILDRIQRDDVQAYDSPGIIRLWLDYFAEHCYPYRRGNGHDILYYCDFAASAQVTFENVALALARRLKQLCGAADLALSGGCALNGKMNARLCTERLFNRVYAFPAAHDAGTSLGAALALHVALTREAPGGEALRGVDFGCAFGDSDIEHLLTDQGLCFEKMSSDELAKRVADDLFDGRVVGWFRGRDEFGPRALGQRSFLGNPARRDLLQRLNEIKGREYWRPLAPSVLAEYVPQIFEEPVEPALDRFMLRVSTVRAPWRHRIPAVVHSDQTSRLHIVERGASDVAYHTLIEAFQRKSGIPLICNTSFNIAGRPLAHTPTDALNIFQRTGGVQVLVVGDYYVRKTED
jgi:carbamoyltransferase